MATPAAEGKIVLSFGWEGPNSWQESVVNLAFKNAKTEIYVCIPDNISPSTVQKLSFTCQRYREGECHKTYPDSLRVTIEQIRNLTIKKGIFEEPRVFRSAGEIKLEVPKELEIGQTYCLVATSLSARLQKKESRHSAMKEERKVSQDEFQRRMEKMGEALVEVGVQNLHLASKGGAGVFDISSTNADIFAHGMQGVIRSAQHMHPDIQVPYTKPSESPSDLDTLSKEELQLRFDETLKKDQEFETRRMRAAIAGNIQEMNRITELEHPNSQLLINLAEALERKKIKAQIPQSESFKSAVNESVEAHIEALEIAQERCKLQ